MPASAERIAALPEQSVAEALYHLADKLTEAFHSNLLVLMEEDSAEPVHKARVALRRLRVLIGAFEPILDEDVAEALLARSRTLFRLLGSVRDADVMVARFAETDRAEATAKEAAEQRRKARKHLKSKKSAGFRDWVLKRLSGKSWRRSGKKAKALRESPVDQMAVSALNRAWDMCETNGAHLMNMSARAQHDLRKDLKTLRYLAEFFADIWPGDDQDAFLADLRELQDDLGELTDSALARSRGLADGITDSDPQVRAADAWAALLAQGPWWVPVNRPG